MALAHDATGARDRRRFFVACAALWCFFAAIAWLTPIVLDDWFEVVFIKRHGLTPASVWEYASFNYVNYNPRLGETLLLVVNGPRIIHVLLTPSVELLLLFVVFVLAHGRWPRATAADARRLLVAQALLFTIVPSVGLLYFYRPYLTNYLYGTCIQLLLFVPYRLELSRPTASAPRAAWVPLLFVGGLAAGMTNEHTGPTAMLVVAGLTWLLWRAGRARAWGLAGALGLWIGYLLLFFAPGQTKRYGGAAKVGPLTTLVERGFQGARDVVVSFTWEAQLAIIVVLAAVAGANLAARRRGATPATPTRFELGVSLVALAAGASILTTMMASPMVGERLYFAPAVLLVVALLPFLNLVQDEPAVRRALLVGALVVLGYRSVRTGVEFVMARTAFDRRMAILEHTPPGTVARVPPYLRWSTTSLFFGDDFRTFTHRQYVAHEYFGLAGIELDHAGPWAEPTPPFQLDYQLRFDPPLDEDGWRRHVDMPTYTASYVEWVIAKIRRALPALTTIPGHALRDITVTVRGLDLPELAGRPLVWLRWKDGVYEYPEGGVLVDDSMMPYFVVKKPNLPAGWQEAWVVGCGRTERVPIVTIDKGVSLAFQPRCHGSYVAIACAPDRCWLAAVTWR